MSDTKHYLLVVSAHLDYLASHTGRLVYSANKETLQKVYNKLLEISGDSGALTHIFKQALKWHDLFDTPPDIMTFRSGKWQHNIYFVMTPEEHAIWQLNQESK